MENPMHERFVIAAVFLFSFSGTCQAQAAAAGIHSLDEHWNGGGYPNHLQGQEIPVFSRIANLAQTLEVFFAAHGPHAAIEAVQQRSSRWFDPELVKAAESLCIEGSLWEGLESKQLLQDVLTLEPEQRRLLAGDTTIDNICVAFADIIDAKSPFTYQHSNGVAAAALDIAGHFGMSKIEKKQLWRAALLHDIGKLSVSNDILEKPGKLTNEEWQVVRDHPYYTLQILKRIPAFKSFSSDAAAHHERLDGSGYWRSLSGEQLSMSARILSVADVFDALRAKRPYRDALPLEKVFAIMREDSPRALDLPCLEALISSTYGHSLVGPETEVLGQSQLTLQEKKL
jgi:putative nucleotidyltransferase with HDIG domain